MKDYFCGPFGQQRLRDALRRHIVVGCEDGVLERVAQLVTISALSRGDTLFAQGQADRDVHLVLLGPGFDLTVDGIPVPVRADGEFISELSVENVVLPRLASATARGGTIVGTLAAADVDELARTHPHVVLRGLTRDLAAQSCERSWTAQRHASPTRIYMRSSLETSPLAAALEDKLTRAGRETFASSKLNTRSAIALEYRCKGPSTFDFAILILDATATSAASPGRSLLPASWIFELGMFAGALGRDRVRAVIPHELETKTLASFGIQLLSYDPNRPLAAALPTLGHEIDLMVAGKPARPTFGAPRIKPEDAR